MQFRDERHREAWVSQEKAIEANRRRVESESNRMESERSGQFQEKLAREIHNRLDRADRQEYRDMVKRSYS